MFLRFSFDEFEGFPGDFGGDAVFAAGEFLAVGTVADRGAGVVGGGEREFVADCAAVATTWVDCHFMD